MRGLVMDSQLTVRSLVERAETYFGAQSICWRDADGGWVESDYRTVVRRGRALGAGLHGLGLEHGDRVATLCWNHGAHLEMFFGLPSSGLVVTPLNARLHPHDLGYIVRRANAKVLIVDASLMPIARQFLRGSRVELVLVVGEAYYDDLVRDADLSNLSGFIDERDAAWLTFTSGTTGTPKGVLHSHRSVCLHALALALETQLDVDDVVGPAVQLYHQGAWGYPYAAALVGAGLVLHNRFLHTEELLDAIARQGITWSAGVPTIWRPVAERLPIRNTLRGVHVGGTPPDAKLRDDLQTKNVALFHGYGSTEMQLATHGSGAKQGVPAPFMEMRVVDGEVEVRGPWVASAYYDEPLGESWRDGWFRTGDLGRVDGGELEVLDRRKDAIKSGGEWISTLQFENVFTEHQAIAEACVVGLPDDRWEERPYALVVLNSGYASFDRKILFADVERHLGTQVPKWWLPVEITEVAQIPRTSVGKPDKSAVRRLLEHRREVGVCEHNRPRDIPCLSCSGPWR